jgi:hypothetical protein
LHLAEQISQITRAVWLTLRTATIRLFPEFAVRLAHVAATV